MDIDIKIKPKCLQPRPATLPTIVFLLIYFVEIDGLVISPVLYTNRHISCKHLFMDTKMDIHTKITNLRLTTINILPLYFYICVIVKY